MIDAYLIVNAFLRHGSFLEMERAFLEAAALTGVRLEIHTNADFVEEHKLFKLPSKILFFDKDLRLAWRMEHKQSRLFNSMNAIAVCDDKTLTSLVLKEHSIPQPKTLLCPMTYPGVGYGDFAFLEEAAQGLGFPMVVKQGKGSFGKQVYLVHTMVELENLVHQLGANEILFQEFIGETAGQDLRLYVVGSQVIAAIKRINHSGDFRANVENGATPVPYEPSDDEKALALATSKACGTDFAGIDLLQSHQGPLVCEVNSNAHFLGLRAVTGIDPAISILEHMKGSK